MPLLAAIGHQNNPPRGGGGPPAEFPGGVLLLTTQIDLPADVGLRSIAMGPVPKTVSLSRRVVPTDAVLTVPLAVPHTTNSSILAIDSDDDILLFGESP